MSLGQRLSSFHSEFNKTAPKERAALYDAGIEEMRRHFPLNRATKAGNIAPSFTLSDAFGKAISLSAVLKDGPAVVTFYRGGWCPYCVIQLQEYQRYLHEIIALGAKLLAVSPQLPRGSLSVAKENRLNFDVLSDTGNQVARSFGLVYAVPAELRQALTSVGVSLPSFNGDQSWELPLTATYVVAPSGLVTLAFVEVDYRQRLEPEEILSALKRLRGGAL